MLHGAIFLFPVALATLCLQRGDGGHSLARGWIVVFAIEIVLYVVGTAFIVLILAKDRTVNVYKIAAATDPLTGVLNRRGFFEAAPMLHAAQSSQHGAGQRACLRPRSLQADQRPMRTCGRAMQCCNCLPRSRARRSAPSDIIGRLGGEEFVALLPSTLPEAAIAAERVRAAFAAASIVRNGQQIAATVSIGVASARRPRRWICSSRAPTRRSTAPRRMGATGSRPRRCD